MEGVAPERGVISGGGGPGDDADAGIAETGCVVRRMPSVANLHRDIAQALKHLGRSHRPLPSSHATLGALCFLQGKKSARATAWSPSGCCTCQGDTGSAEPGNLMGCLRVT